MSNEIKTALKEARELLKQKEHAEAIKICKKILKKDKANYTALVLLGAAMTEVAEMKQQAPLALQKAIDVQPNNPLAWQGLIAYYEKEPPNTKEAWTTLTLAYCKLLQLDSNSPKFPFFLDKVSDLCLKFRDETVVSQIIEMLSQLRKECNADKISRVNKTLAWILTLCPNSANGHWDVMTEVLMVVAKDTDMENRQQYYRQYLEALYKLGRFDVLIAEAAQMHEQYPQDIRPLDWICRVYYEQNYLDGVDTEIEVSQYYEALLQLDAQSENAIIAKAVHLKTLDNLIKARECLSQMISLNPQSQRAWAILSEISLRLYCFEDAEVAATQTLQLMKDESDSELYYRVKLILIESLSKTDSRQKWEDAAKMCEKIMAKAPSTRLQVMLARVKVLVGESDAGDRLNKLESQEETKVEAVLLRALDLKKRNCLEEAADVLGSVLETSEVWSLLGKIYWELADYSHSLMALLNAVRSDRYNWESLVYLGHYYHEHGNDIERARKCYQTALQINPNSEQAGIGLSTAYRLLKNSDANMQLLQRVTTQGSGPKWAWLQLGLQYLNQGNAGQAIKALQHVIRTDPNDNHSWESLADAYLARGAYTSALKSYQRVLELCPESLYPMIQLANIKLAIGQLDEAKTDFEHILQTKQNYVPALKGLAETCLSLAKENFQKQFLGRSRDNLQQAMDSLTDAVIALSDVSCLWKLMGDVCYKTAALSEKYCFLGIRASLLKSQSTEERITIKKRELYLLATRCYCRALSLCQNSALLWHDLACCYFMQLDTVPPEERKDVLGKSFAAAKYAVKLCPTSWLHWNVLGVICTSSEIKNYALAQHSYIMAIDREPNNAIAWCNLGTLYLHLGELYRANEAFSRGQRADPAYINTWIGQAMIAERVKRREAMDLFRHSTQLGYHGQAALGYAHWVLLTLLNPEAKNDLLYTYSIINMHAVTVATDVLNWYIEHHPKDIYALNAYGLLLERQKLYRSAAEQFTTALRLCDDEHKDDLRVNLTRMLIRLQRFAEAVKLCRTVEKATFNSQCHLALSLFKDEQFEESYATYESALQWLADTDSDKANMLCAMAAMAYTFQGVDDAKTLLFQCIQIQPPLIDGFLAAASLGVLHGDLNLTVLVLKELRCYQDHTEYGHHIASLLAFFYIMQDNITSAVRTLSKAIHRHPDDARYWVGLIKILLEVDMATFGKCAHKALFLGRSVPDINIVHVAAASTFSELANPSTNEALRSAQKTLFSFPANVETWANFIVAMLHRHARKETVPTSEWLSTLIAVVSKNFQSTRQMTQWLWNNKRMIDNMAD